MAEPTQSGPLQVLDVTPEDSGIGAGAQVKSTPKGISPAGSYSLDPTETKKLLERMQEMVAQKTGGWHDFMGGIQDALAYATPQQSGQQALALQYRNQQKAQEAQDVFSMRQQMAALQSAQTQAEANRMNASRFMGGTGGTGGVGGAGTTGGTGAGGAAGTFASLTPEAQASIMNARPEEQWGMIQEALKKQSDARLKGSFEAAGNKQETYFVPGVGNVMMTPNQFRDLPPEVKTKIQQATLKRFGSLPAAAAEAPQLQPQGNAVALAKSLNIPFTSGDRSNQRQAELKAASKQEGYSGPPVAEPGKSQHNFGNAIDVNINKLTPQQRADLQANFEQPLPKTDPNHWEVKGARAASQQQPSYQVASNAPVAPPKAIPTAGAPVVPSAPKVSKMPNPAEYNSPAEYQAALKQFEETEAQRRTIETKQAESDIATRAEAGKEVAKGSGTMIKGILAEAKKAPEVINSADRVIKHAMDRPKEFGYAYQQDNKMLAGAAALPGIGAITETVAPAFFGAPGETNRRTQTDTDASKLGLDFASQMFSGTGARLGVGLEQMAANAKGVGSKLPASTNALNANLVKVAAEKAQDIAKLWHEWAPSHGGIDNANGNEFVQTPEYQALEKRWDKRLVDFDKELARKFPDVYMPYKEETKKNRRPLSELIPGAKQ